MNRPETPIPIAHPFVPPTAAEAVARVLAGRWIGQGPLVDQFERDFERKFGIAEGHAVAMNSGTSALELAYDLLQLDDSHTVLTTPLTCTATNIPLVRRKVDLRFGDISREDLNLLPYWGSPIWPDAAVNVNLHGNVCAFWKDAPEDCPVIDDAAQALGPPRPEARFTAYSFQAIKHITTGDGGMLVCQRKADADEARLRRWFGIDRRKKLANNWQPYKDRAILFDIKYPGYKFQMNDIAAALGIEGLKFYDEIMDHRRRVFDIYRQAGLPLVDSAENRYGYACLLLENRDAFAAAMAEANIETNVMQVRNDLYEVFAPYRRPLPNMDWVESRYLCIPLHNRLTIEEAEYIAEVGRKAVRL